MTKSRFLIKFHSVSQIAAALLLLSAYYANSQTKDKTTGQQSLELPIIVVQGQDKFDVPAVLKKNPENTPPASRGRLDSLNSLEKRPPAFLSPAGLPEPERMPRFANGFIEGAFGRYTTPDFQAGLGFELGNYRLYADANAEASSGHVDNAGYIKYGGGLSASYIAPEKFIFFGGSRTESALRFGQRFYKLYGQQEQSQQAAPERTVSLFSIGANISGAYDGYSYSAAGSWSAAGISQNNFDGADNGLSGSLNVSRELDGYSVGARLLLDLRAIGGAGYHFIELDGTYSAIIDGTSIEAEAGAQTTSSILGASAFAFHACGKTRIPISDNFSFAASVRTGLEQTSFSNFLSENPYINPRADIDFAKTDLAFAAMLYYHPIPGLSAGFGCKISIQDNSPYYRPDSIGMFKLGYAGVSRGEALAEAIWKSQDGDMASANIAFVSTLFRNGAGAVPYSPSLRASAEWSRDWSAIIGTSVSAVWNGKRYALINEKQEIGEWIDLGFRANYTLQPNISFFARLSNIANSTAIIWNGYLERGVSGAVGVLWKF